jgi:D-lactate dehydrogenase
MKLKGLSEIIPLDRIRTKYIDLVSFASDAGFYHLVPQAVVQPINEQEIIGLFKFSQAQRIPLVFRAGGTSLSGQSITDGILVDLSQHWSNVSVENNGLQVRVQPGITGAMVNSFLKKHQRKIGPDPSSISAAMMGGILSNNASGMCCGVALNSYHTTRFIRFILPNGKVFSTENMEDYTRFEIECPAICIELNSIRQQIFADSELFEKIRMKYRTKNTVGYSINSLIDFEHPMDILAHLLIGGEGTLAFISEAVINTVPDYPFKSTGILYFNDIYAACQAIEPLNSAGALMVELMDSASLKAIQKMEGIPEVIKILPEGAAALLVEFQNDSLHVLQETVAAFLITTEGLMLFEPPIFTNVPKEIDFLWKVRKGLFPAVGAVRASGTTVILEDLTFPVSRLGEAILDLQKLFIQYKYTNAIIFGHAKDGNIHFVITQSFGSEEEISRYEDFMKQVVDLVVHRYNGSLKAEHGTGRNMAPFVETEWGGVAYNIMCKIKQLIDPLSLLNPGVIINGDDRVHLKNLKDLPSVESEVDRCIECGYCEHRCPSKDITMTPRRRIVVRRVLKTLQAQNDHINYDLLLKQYQYEGMDTCAVDGLCASACPVDINTGDLIKRLRRENHSTVANVLALCIARQFKLTEQVLRFALRLGYFVNVLFGAKTMYRLTMGLKKIAKNSPIWSSELTAPPKKLTYRNTGSLKTDGIVYFPACISRMLGSYSGKEKDLMETFLSVCQKSNIQVRLINDLAGSCCSQIFSSKGFNDAYNYMANEIIQKLWLASGDGMYPVVIDVSSCAYTLHNLRPQLSPANQISYDRLKIMDSVDFIHDRVLPKIQVRQKKRSIVLHSVCALEKMKIAHKFTAIAQYCAEEVVVPKYNNCCGMAGDRGFIFPELTSSATLAESLEVKQRSYEGYYSSTKTCEMAMSNAVKVNYQSILYLVDEVTC